MGSPQVIEGADYGRLEAASKLALIESGTLEADADQFLLPMLLPRQGVSLFRLDWEPEG
jgi:hypothetical protein